MGSDVKLKRWTISTNVDAQIETVESEHEGKYVLIVNGFNVVSVFISTGSTLQVKAKDGYIVQMITEKKYISIIEDT